jgi:hypothetical protein
MCLWSLHPEYQDPRGLVALWREALWCRRFSEVKGAVMSPPSIGSFSGFGVARRPLPRYLYVVYAEAERRGYHFDVQRIPSEGHVDCVEVTHGQLAYEREYLKQSCNRSPSWLTSIESASIPKPHPLFCIVSGTVAEWEVTNPQETFARTRKS